MDDPSLWDEEEDRPFRFTPFWFAVIATMVWIVGTGWLVSSRHDVPTIAAYKSEYRHFAECQAVHPADSAAVQACMEADHAALMRDWRHDTGLKVILPPTLAWAAGLALLLMRDLRRRA